MKNKSFTSSLSLPIPIIKHLNCLLLHVKVPIMTENGIKHVCKICEGIKEKCISGE